jgi:hypothetical protein
MAVLLFTQSVKCRTAHPLKVESEVLLMSVDKNGNWLWSPADIGRWDEKPYINPYAHYEVPQLEEFREHLRKQRYVHLNTYINSRQMVGGAEVVQDVPVDLIIGTSEGDSWDFTDRHRDEDSIPEEYVWKMAQALKAGMLRLPSTAEPISLVELDGNYFVMNNGRHRIAALKGMKGDNVVAVGAEVWSKVRFRK